MSKIVQRRWERRKNFHAIFPSLESRRWTIHAMKNIFVSRLRKVDQNRPRIHRTKTKPQILCVKAPAVLC
jgi:hypothetical protein